MASAEGLDRSANAVRALAAINEGAKHTDDAAAPIKRVMENLKTFARIDEAAYKEIAVHTGLEAAVELLKPTVARGVEFELDFGTDAKVFGCPGEINQMFMHLLQNAASAVGETGQIRVETRSGAAGVVIRVADTGHGFSSAISDRGPIRLLVYFAARRVRRPRYVYGYYANHSARRSCTVRDACPGHLSFASQLQSHPWMRRHA